MAQRRKMEVGGRMVDVIDVDFEVTEEQWNRYRLLDGGEVRLKTTPLKVYRVLDPDGKPAIDNDGDPVCAVKHTTQVIAQGG